MNLIKKLIQRIDNFQRSHLSLGFPYAVIKKYGEDNGGYQSALITYYGFLSLFPLLIVFTSLTQLILKNDPVLRNQISASVSHYLPLIGHQLQQATHSPKKTGLALIISLLITLYAARGGANALQYTISSLWHIPNTKRPPFLKNVLRSFGIIFGGGLGLVAATILSGYTAILGHSVYVKVLSILLSTILLWATFIVIFKLSIAGNKPIKKVLYGAGVTAVGLQILQSAGSSLLAHQLKGLDSAYGTFAIVLGLLFWIYLQAQVILYAVEIDVVREYSLFPRSIQGKLTPADKAAFASLTKSNKLHKAE